MNNFDYAFDRVIKFEGGYINDKDDSGGETKYGISKNTFPHLKIADLTLADAREIYYQEYWVANKYDNIENCKVAAKIFDMAVNMGARNAHINTQRALMACGVRLKWDGIAGVKTFAAINDTPAEVLCAALRAEQASYYERLAAKRPEKQKFLVGWLSRAYA